MFSFPCIHSEWKDVRPNMVFWKVLSLFNRKYPTIQQISNSQEHPLLVPFQLNYQKYN